MISSLIEKRGIIIAVVSALIATILVVLWLNQQQRQTAGELADKFGTLHKNTIEAIFAKTDIPQGKLISDEMLYTKPMTKDSLPSGAAISIARVLDRAATVNIKKDTMIYTEAVGWPTTKETTLAMKTPIGKRAITISVDNISALVGMIKPGDYVDVISLIPLPAEVEGKLTTQPATVPLFQNVAVLAVGSRIGTVFEDEGGQRRRQKDEEREEPQEASPLITLALGPEEANLLVFVQEQGKIRLILRSPGDAAAEPVQPASWETLLKYLFPDMDLRPKEIKQEAPPEIKEVEVIRGSTREMLPLLQK